MSVFEENFLLLRDPAGGVEDLQWMRDAGFEGVFCNIGDHDPTAWEAVVRPRAQSLGMFCGPWLHTREGSGTFSTDKLEALIDCADKWGSPLIVNSEKEIDGSGDACTSLIANWVGHRDAAISMEAWLFNPPSVDWTPVAHLPMLLQIFPQESPPSTDPEGCKEHAHDCDIRCVYFTFGTYGNAEPNWFNLQAPYSLYTGDDCGQAYYRWSPTSTGFQGCRDEPEPPDPEPPPDGGDVVAVGAAQSCREAWNNLCQASTLDAWRRDNPGEWQKLQAYWIAESGTGPPAGINSAMGKAHLAVIEARRYAEGSHA